MLAAGAPGGPLQFIDVRDLAGFVLGLAEEDRSGTFNATGKVVTFESFLVTCK